MLSKNWLTFKLPPQDPNNSGTYIFKTDLSWFTHVMSYFYNCHTVTVLEDEQFKPAFA